MEAQLHLDSLHLSCFLGCQDSSRSCNEDEVRHNLQPDTGTGVEGRVVNIATCICCILIASFTFGSLELKAYNFDQQNTMHGDTFRPRWKCVFQPHRCQKISLVCEMSRNKSTCCIACNAFYSHVLEDGLYYNSWTKESSDRGRKGVYLFLDFCFVLFFPL